MVSNIKEVPLAIIIVGTFVILLVGYGYIPLNAFNAVLTNFFAWTLVNLLTSIIIGCIILPFNNLLKSIVSFSLEDIKIIEENLLIGWLSLRVSISLFFVLELILTVKFFR